ncbi:Hypothetical predicted protein [Olea europaea subsp. europaea]|uniref:Uncharacterized protein n=1 Tax=Olea europaea subsp. europaea TaxID=158383 RepID=A0A8S0R4G3_OLEEU|nr:Hypothetical predicted protein [Olea europaea subsp. europaea]
MGGSIISVPNSSSGLQRSHHQHSKYQTPPAALYEPTENTRASTASVSSEKYASEIKGHHLGDFFPPDELEKFSSTYNDAAARKAAKEAAERAKIQADNVGHTSFCLKWVGRKVRGLGA